MQSASVSSKALKVLLALILAIGLMPAIHTQQAFAAAGTLMINGVAINDGDRDSKDAWDFKSGVLTIRGAIEGAVVVTNGDITIKSSNAAASITAKDKTAVDVSGDLTIDTKMAPIAIVTKAVDETAATPAINVAGTLTTEAGTSSAVAGEITATTELTSDTDYADVVATGAATIGEYSTLNATLKGADAVTVNGALEGDVLATDLLTVAATGSIVGNVTADAGVIMGGSHIGNADVTGAYAAKSDSSVLGNVEATGAVTVNGSLLGDVSTADAVVVADAADGVIDGDILAAQAVTVGSATYAGSVTGNIGTLVDGAPSVEGDVTVGVDASLNPLDGKSTVGGDIVTSADVVLNGTAVLTGKAAIVSGQTITVEKFASVNAQAIALDYGATIENNSTASIVVALTQGGTFSVVAGESYTNADFTVAIDETEFPEYNAAEITDLVAAFGAALTVKNSAGTEVTSGDYKLSLVPATEGQKVIEAGSYTLKVEAKTPGGNAIKGSINVAVEVTKAKLDAVTVADIAPVKWTGEAIEPPVTVKIGASTVDPENYTVSYYNNTNLGAATAFVVFENDASVEAGALMQKFQISGDPAKSLAGATITLANSGTFTFTGADLAAGIVTGVSLSGDIAASVDLTFYDEAGNKVEKVIQPGKYKVAVTGKAGTGYTDSKTANFVVNADYTVAGWSMSLNNITNPVYTGSAAVTSAASARLVFQKGDIYFAYTLKGDALTVTSTSVNAGQVAINQVGIADSAMTYLTGSVAGAKVEQKTFTVKPLDLATAEIAYGALNSIDNTIVDPATVVYSSADQAVTLAGKSVYVKNGKSWNKITAGVKVVVNPTATNAQGVAIDADTYAVRISATTAQTNVTGSKTLAASAIIEPAELTGETFTATAGTYNTLAQLPTDAWTHSVTNEALVYGEDYTMTAVDADGKPINAIDAGAYAVKVVGMGNYTETTPVTFTINKLALNDASVSSNADGVNLPYTQAEQKPLTELYAETTNADGLVEKHIIPSANYTVTYASNTAIGAATATVAPVKNNKNLSSTKTVNFNIKATNDLSVAKVTLESTNITYDGKDHTNKVVSIVAADGKTLVKDLDYTVGGTATGKAAGDYTITVTGEGAYTGTQSVKWTIDPQSIEDADVIGVRDLKWDGVVTINSAAPTSVLLGETKLVSGTDYDSAFTFEKYDVADMKWKAATSSDKAVGKYRVIVKGKTNYTGECVSEFSVTGISLATFTFGLNNATAAYTGSPIAPVLKDTPATGAFSKLASGTDYAAVVYYDAACLLPVVDEDGENVDPTDVGTYYVRVDAVEGGNAMGSSLAIPFKITAKAITPDTTDKTKTYNGEAQSPLTVKDSAIVLEEGVDYTVEYKNADGVVVKPTNAGTYSATIKAVAGGNYTFSSGTAVTGIKINPLGVDIDQTVYSVAPQVETGKQITPAVPNTLEVTATVTNAAGEQVDATFTLKKTTDYTITYGANKALGKNGGSVVFTEGADSNFSINSNPKSITFDIVTINDLSAATVGAIGSQSFTGQQIKPELSVVAADGKTLVEGTDYAVSYVNNVEVGTAIVIIKGIGSYVGTTETSFVITAGTHRIAGENRFETMSALVADGFDSADTVIVTNGWKAPDALAAAGLAGTLDAPVITTDGANLTFEAAMTISTLGATKAIVLGDTNSVSADVVDALNTLGLSVKRLEGNTRIETSLEIYKAGMGSYGKTAILASGYESADALSAASFAYATDSAVFLANENGSIDSAVANALTSGAFNRVIVLGGNDRVDAATRVALKAALGDEGVVEIAGANRFATSAQLIDFAVAEGALDFSNVYVTTGFNFADALAAGAPAGKRGIPVLLVADDANAYKAIDSIIGSHKDVIKSVNVLGDANAVSDNVEAYILDALK